MMDAVQKAKWVAALRSGKYAQGREVLLDDEQRYCPLGVFCEIAQLQKRRFHSAYIFFDIDGDVSALHLPTRSFLEFFDVPYDEALKIARMNDHGASFSEIALYIEHSPVL